MEILKTINAKQILPFISFVILSLNINGQNYKEIQTAFEISIAQEKDGKFQDALNTMKKVYDENSYEVNLRLGWLSYLSGIFNESIAYYNRCLQLKPMSIEAYFGIVYPTAALGNFDQLNTYYNHILEIDPQNTIANYRIGLIYYGRKDYQTASKYLQKVLDLYPFDYDTLVLFGWTNLQLGKYREAKVLFNKSLYLKPNDKSALEGLSLIK